MGTDLETDPAVVDWWQVFVVTLLICGFWLFLVPARTLLLSRGWAPVVVAPWLASLPHWVPGEPLGMGPGLGTGLTGWTLQHPLVTARLVAERVHRRAAGSKTATAIRTAFHEWWELESQPGAQIGRAHV